MLWLLADDVQYYDEVGVLPYLDLGLARFELLQSVPEVIIGDSAENSNATVTLINNDLTQRFATPPVTATLFEVSNNTVSTVFSGRVVTVSISSTIVIGIES